MTAEYAMAKAREISQHPEDHLRIAMELLEAHKVGKLEGIDLMTEQLRANAEAKFEPDQLLDVWEGDDRLEGHLPR